MAVNVQIINENGEPEQIEVSSEDVRAQILAQRELASAMNRVASAIRVKGGV